MKFKSKIFYLYLLLVIVYATLLLILPPAPATLHKYHLSASGIRLLDLTIIIPYALIWLAGFWGYAHLKDYAKAVKRSKDGRHVNTIADGLLWLVLWLSLSAILSSILNYLAQKHPAATASTIVINNYFSLLMPLVGFIIIGFGTRGLNRLARLHPSYRAMGGIAFVLIAAGVFYSYLVLNTDNRLHSIYHMPAAVVLATLVIPYIYMWFVGLFSVYQIYLYRRHAPGVVYRKSWGWLALGLGLLLVIQILLQYVVTLTEQLNHLSLGGVLIFVYVLLIILAGGYLMVARGAKNLLKIEEV